MCVSVRCLCACVCLEEGYKSCARGMRAFAKNDRRSALDRVEGIKGERRREPLGRFDYADMYIDLTGCVPRVGVLGSTFFRNHPMPLLFGEYAYVRLSLLGESGAKPAS